MEFIFNVFSINLLGKKKNAALLLTGCRGWERPDASGVTSLGGGAGSWSSRLVESSNSSGVMVDCDWTVDNQRRQANNRHLQDGPVADGAKSSDGIALSWLDSNRQPVVSIPGLRYSLAQSQYIHFNCLCWRLATSQRRPKCGSDPADPHHITIDSATPFARRSSDSLVGF